VRQNWPTLPRRHTLVGAYGSFAPPDGARLHASRYELRRLATFVRGGSATEIKLAPPPERLTESDAIRAIRVLTHDDGPVSLRRATGSDIEIVGGATARGRLANTLENLADSPPTETSVTRHVDLEYLPGHGFLSEQSMWISVYQDATAND
jgi:hypothetical protein